MTKIQEAGFETWMSLANIVPIEKKEFKLELQGQGGDRIYFSADEIRSNAFIEIYEKLPHPETLEIIKEIITDHYIKNSIKFEELRHVITFINNLPTKKNIS